MAKELNYQQARRIREHSISSLFADQLIAGKGYQEGFKNVLSLKSKAVSKGFKEKIDPLNIAKVLTGGSRLGPALVGKMLGRSKKDIEYFAGRAMPLFDKIAKISQMEDSAGEETPKGTKGNKGDSIKGIKTVLNKILTFLNKSYDKEVALQEKENNFKESYKLADDKRHNELLKVLAGIAGGNATEGGEKGKKKLDIFKKLRDKIKLKVGQRLLASGINAAAIATTERAATAAAPAVGITAAEVAAKEATAVAVAKTVLGKVANFTATKLIPGYMLGSGLWQATKSAMDGDLYGAALHAASGAIGTIPYFTLNPLAVAGGAAASGAIDIYAAIRDVYKEVWGNYPEKDKDSKDFPAKMKVVTDAVKSIVGPSKQWENGKPPVLTTAKRIEEHEQTLKAVETELPSAMSDAYKTNKPGAAGKLQQLNARRDSLREEIAKLKEQQKKENEEASNTDTSTTPSATPVSDENKFPAEWGVPDNYQLPKGWTKEEIQKDIVNKGFKYNKEDNAWINPVVQGDGQGRFDGKWRLNADGDYRIQYIKKGKTNIRTLNKEFQQISDQSFGALDNKSLTPVNDVSRDVQTAMATPKAESMDSTNENYAKLSQKQTENLNLNLDKNTPKPNQDDSKPNNLVMAKNDDRMADRPVSSVSVRDASLMKTLTNLTVAV